MLPGDVNHNGGCVNAIDLGQVRARQLTSTTNPGTAPNTYDIFNDVNGNGTINAIDLGVVNAAQKTGLPAGLPEGAPAGEGVPADTSCPPVIESTAWEAIDSGLANNTGNGSPGTAVGLEMFPDKLPSRPVDTVDRSRVRVKVKLDVPRAGVEVFFKAVDVDDPSANTAPVDDEAAEQTIAAPDRSRRRLL